MSYTLNQVTLIGRVGQIKENTYNGNLRLQFSLATDRPSYIKDGVEQTPIVDWHYITVWRDRAQMCKDRLKTGDLISVTGEVRYNKDKKDPGGKIYTEIYIPDNAKIGFLSTSRKNQEQIQEHESMPIINGVKPYASSYRTPSPFKKDIILEDDIPF